MSSDAAQFNIARIYLLDLSLEAPGGADSFLIDSANNQPQVEIQIQSRARHFRDDLHEVVLTASVKTHLHQRTLFMVEAQQAGLFQLQHIPDADVPRLLNVTCPEILFPYLREAISDATLKASFPPMLLAPINFEALYQHSQSSASMEGSSAKMPVVN